MTTETLNAVLMQIAEDFRHDIDIHSRYIIEVDIGDRAERMGLADDVLRYRGVDAVVPVSAPKAGMKVRIDGRTFVDYAMTDLGVAVPGFVARATTLDHRPFVPNHSLIRHFH